jgi:DNA-binding PadR family transcriptional regulator
MSRISHREAAILGLLCEGPQHGYELEKIIEERRMRAWTEIGFSSIYYVLKRLERRGFVESTVKEVEGRPSRKVYSVTEKGRTVMKEKVESVLSQRKKVISPFDLGIAYSHLLEPEKMVKCLNLYRKSLERNITFLEGSISEKKKEGANYRVIALFSLPLARVKAEKEWVEQFKKDMERRYEYGTDSP